MGGRNRCFSGPWGKYLLPDSCWIKSEQEAEGVISSILSGFVSAHSILCVPGFSFHCLFCFPFDLSISLLFLQYRFFPLRLGAALRDQQKCADIISKDPVIAWMGVKGRVGDQGGEEGERYTEDGRCEEEEEGGKQELGIKREYCSSLSDSTHTHTTHTPMNWIMRL